MNENHHLPTWIFKVFSSLPWAANLMMRRSCRAVFGFDYWHAPRRYSFWLLGWRSWATRDGTLRLLIEEIPSSCNEFFQQVLMPSRNDEMAIREIPWMRCWWWSTNDLRLLYFMNFQELLVEFSPLSYDQIKRIENRRCLNVGKKL